MLTSGLIIDIITYKDQRENVQIIDKCISINIGFSKLNGFDVQQVVVDVGNQILVQHNRKDFRQHHGNDQACEL
jgi:hypothetical protein